MSDFDPNAFDRAAWIAQAKALLDDSARDLDAATLSRLNRARQSALAQAARPRQRIWLLPAGLASACALVLAFVFWQPHHHGMPGSAAVALDTADAAADADMPEFYQDLEFYAWLDAQAKDGEG
jgi:hypothetical protein